jgi:GT2 family glycosyltransferase
MGAFNEWVAGSFLQAPERRTVATVARNILYGAAFLIRANILRYQGITLPEDALYLEPLEDRQLKEYLS